MEEDVLNALQTRAAYLPGGFDREGRILFVVNIVHDLQLWNRKCLELSIAYLRRSLSPSLLQKGAAVIVDAQKCSSRITRTHSRTIHGLFGETAVTLYLVRSEGFWEKHVEPCTKSHTKGEPIVLSKARLCKYFDPSNLPAELDGTLQFNYDLWLQQRKSIDEFHKTYEQTLNAMENLHVLLLSNRSLRPSEADQELRKCTQMHALVQRQIEGAIELGNRILTRLVEAYPLPPRPHATTTASDADPDTTTSTAAATTATATPKTVAPAATTTTTAGVRASENRPRLPPDLSCERGRIELRLNEIERRQTSIRTAWLELLQSIREARELATLEEGVAFVTNWILSTAEQLLSRQTAIGGDARASEELRGAHNALEMECRETYGFYAELLYKIDAFAGPKDSFAFKDLVSQRDFMQFVCRSFATRLERRRNVLITAQRFYRLVGEYFERTSAVFESLVMGSHHQRAEADFAAAGSNLQKLKDSQASLASMERELRREGEKLSDMLAMPVKDALGRDLRVDYSEDIANIRDILETTATRRNIFSDSVELQKLTLEQVTHIHAYEQDARMAAQWMDDLYDVMVRCHSHVGCNIHEIQVQKDELQTFQETGKSIFHYGSQLLEASHALRLSCKLDPAVPQRLLQQLRRTWHSLQAISQEHMTRLRVSAVFHRSVEDYCGQLHELKLAVRRIGARAPGGSGSSSSGVSSENEQEPRHDEATTSANAEPKDGVKSTTPTRTSEEADVEATTSLSRRQRLRRCLEQREQLLVEVGRMVRLGRLLKTRLKEPFVLDVLTGKSAMADDLGNDAVTSPSNDSGNGGSELNATPESATSATTTVTVRPTGNNAIACSAIKSKLAEISEVAEALDTIIRDVQEDAELGETNSTNSTSSSSAKKLENLRSNSSEDWHSRSTEDESFATASEGNFTPYSHSSATFQTASGRTSSFISSGKNSFDASEADDSTFAFDMPELTSPPTPMAMHNMSFDSSEHSFLSAQQSPSPPAGSRCRVIPIEIEPRSDDEVLVVEHEGAGAGDTGDDDDSVVGVEELHSQSVTPTPDDQQNQYLLPDHFESIPIESETELELERQASGIADAPSMEILTLETDPPMTSVTPEVSACANASHAPADTNTNKPNAAWRRNKYYENITKQTIKGFL